MASDSTEAGGPVAAPLPPLAHVDRDDHPQWEVASNGPSVVSGLDVDSNTDADSAIGDTNNLSPSTQSLRSSIYDFIEENGRKYHRFKEGKYMLPNDETEQDRLDLQHHLFLLTLHGKLHLAPIENLEGGLHKVLDIATGTGIWAIEFAMTFPSADVVGTDLSPIQPDFVPPNCHFEIDDAEDEWLFTQKFDYIHGRMLASCFKSHLTVFQSAFEATRPGGYVEFQDGVFPFKCIDATMENTAFGRWLDLIAAGSKALGKDFSRAPQYKQYLEEVGFVDVVEKRFAWPIGTWARGTHMKHLGTWAKEDVLAGLQGWTMAVLTRGLGMLTQEVEVLLADVRKDLESKKIHAYIPLVMVYGRKPE